MYSQEKGLELVSLLPGLGARGETQEGYADLSEDGVLQRIALPQARRRVAVNFDDGRRPCVPFGKYGTAFYMGAAPFDGFHSNVVHVFSVDAIPKSY